jgi:hypothetical protein
MQNFETMKDARRVAREVLTGAMDPHLGCGLIGGIGEKLNHHPALTEFIHIAHLLDGPGHEGFTRESLLPDIMVACRELAAVQA